MDLKRILRGNWFSRIVLLSWIVGAVSVLVLFKNMEQIVHGQLYLYNLQYSADWADPYRVYTWLIYISLGLPTALSGIALASSFLRVEKVADRKTIVPQRTRPPLGNVKTESRHAIREAPVKVDNGNGNGICCPKCKKVFSRALVMLDFRSGKNRMVSVCPYCSHVSGYTSGERNISGKIFVARPNEK